MALAKIPPSYFNLFIILTIGFRLLIPLDIFIPAPYSYLGFVFGFGGIVLNIWSTQYLRNSVTQVEFGSRPQTLVTGGPFRFSRNPIYLGGLIMLSGLSIFLGSLITFIFPIALFLILNAVHIPLEEISLEETFGDQYRAYKERVRRWL